MAKSSADDEELRRACEAAIEGTKQQVVMSIRVAKTSGIIGIAGKLSRGAMAKPRVLAISSTAFHFFCCSTSRIIGSQWGLLHVILEFNNVVCAAKAKGQRTKAFLRVLKYSNGGVLEVNTLYFFTMF